MGQRKAPQKKGKNTKKPQKKQTSDAAAKASAPVAAAASAPAAPTETSTVGLRTFEGEPPSYTSVLSEPEGGWRAGEELVDPSGSESGVGSRGDGWKVEVGGLTFEDRLVAARRAAEVHRGVRRHVQESLLHVGADLNHVAEQLEATTKAMVDADGLKRGIAFPTGLSLNACAAHDSPNPRDAPRYLRYSDVLKVDFGVHVDGVIIDCAFTWAPDPKWEQLLAGVQAATETGIREAGVDARLCDIGAAIQETMESYEVDGERIKPIRNLNGHSIEPHLIHAGKSVPCVKGTSESVIMEEGEFFAIETFGSVRGRGEIKEMEGDSACSHYMRAFDPPNAALRLPASKDLLRRINTNFGSLAFSKRQLERDAKASRYIMPLRELVNTGVVEAYPPLMEKSGARVAQFEHTIVLKPTGKEVLSRGPDF